MKEIKFRAWDGKKMYYHFPPDKNDHAVYWTTIGPVGWNVSRISADGLHNKNEIIFGSTRDNSDLMQFIGLNDINNNQIFEGDIIKYWVSRYPENKSIGYVDYNDHCAAFQVRYKNIEDHYVSDFIHKFHFFEVIGNIYQHKHLLS